VTTPRISVVVPAYNEQECVGPLVADTVATLESWEAGTFEIIVVDDGSTDRTPAIVDDLVAGDRRIRVVHRSANGGFGAALKSGYAAAAGELVIAIPADGQCPPDQIVQLANAMGDADICVSGRVDTAKTPGRRTLTLGWHVLVRVLMGFDPRGMDGIYLIRRSVLASLPLKSDTGLINFEILACCTRQGRRMVRHVLPIGPRLGGESKVANVRTILRTMVEMVRLRIRG
jgi:glycosyltransferase involved in cell wall biosynthesis